MTDTYIQLNIAGKLRGWKMNQTTIEFWSKELDTEVFNSSSNYAAIYGGLIANCKVKREEPDFTYEEICDAVDEMMFTEEGKSSLVAVQKIFEESQHYIELVKKLELQLATMKEAVAETKKKAALKPKKKK